MGSEVPWEVVDTRPGTHLVEHSIRSLFEGDGTIYLVTGFFTETAYRSLRPEISGFLERRPDNELVVMANPTADQFSKAIVTELTNGDYTGSVRLLKYPDTFLHAKLYARDGPEPMAILSSANLTRGALEYNLELGIVVEADDPDDPAVRSLIGWAEELADESVPITDRDLFFPRRLLMSVTNWVNKGRLIPPGHIAGKLAPVAALVLVVVGLSLLL